jgi:hypothetical protein
VLLGGAVAALALTASAPEHARPVANVTHDELPVFVDSGNGTPRSSAATASISSCREVLWLRAGSWVREQTGTRHVYDIERCRVDVALPRRPARPSALLICKAPAVARTPDLELLERLRAVIAEQPATEAELRTLTNQADGLVRLLGAQMAGSERRLDDLTSNPESSLAEIATELHRVEALRPRLEEARSLMQELELRARELRTAWLLRR